jgi:hypothetical protein
MGLEMFRGIFVADFTSAMSCKLDCFAHEVGGFTFISLAHHPTLLPMYDYQPLEKLPCLTSDISTYRIPKHVMR